MTCYAIVDCRDTVLSTRESSLSLATWAGTCESRRALEAARDAHEAARKLGGSATGWPSQEVETPELFPVGAEVVFDGDDAVGFVECTMVYCPDLSVSP